MSPAGMVTFSLYVFASSIMAHGGVARNIDTIGLPEDLLGTNARTCLTFSQIPLGCVVYFFHTGTGPPDIVNYGCCKVLDSASAYFKFSHLLFVG